MDKVGPLCTVCETAERFHPRGQQLYKFTGTKEGSYVRKSFSSHRSEDWFEKPTWSLFHCFGTPIWPSWRYENALLLVRTWRHGGHVGGQEQKHFAPLGTKLCCHVNSSKKNLLYWPPTWPPCYMVVIQEYNLLVFSPWFPPTYRDWRSSLKADNIITGKTGLNLWLLKKSSLGFSVMRYHKTGLENYDQADLKTQENNTWESLKGFVGYGISLTWSPGFGILKRNGGGIRDWNQHGMRDAENNHRGYWTEQNVASGWQGCKGSEEKQLFSQAAPNKINEYQTQALFCFCSNWNWLKRRAPTRVECAGLIKLLRLSIKLRKIEGGRGGNGLNVPWVNGKSVWKRYRVCLGKESWSWLKW